MPRKRATYGKPTSLEERATIAIDDGTEGKPLIGMCVRCHRYDDMTLEEEYLWYDLPLCSHCEDEAFTELPWQLAIRAQ